MKKEIDILVKKYGTLAEAARVLGIKQRQLYYVRKGENIGESLAKLIKMRVKLIEMEDI